MRIYVKAFARSSKNEVRKISVEEYEVRTSAPPVKGEANEKIIRMLADYFGVSRQVVKIVGGRTARIKIVDIDE